MSTPNPGDTAPDAGTQVLYIGRRQERHGEYTVAGPCQCRPNRLEDCAGKVQLIRPSGRGLAHIDAANLMLLNPAGAATTSHPTAQKEET